MGCEINTYQDDSFYASTPPLEAKRMLLSEFASRRFQDGHPLKLSFVDIRKAYFNGVPKRALFVRLPKEMGLGPNAVARLDRCMYGTRDAAGIWESCYSDCLASLGFKPGVASPCCFFHEQWRVSVVVHGDDFTALGTAENLDRYERGLATQFELKIRGRLGEAPSDDKEIRILNRIVRILPRGISYEADPRHAELLVKSLGLAESKSVLTPGVKKPYDEAESDTAGIAEDAEEYIASLQARKSPWRVQFNDKPDVFEVRPYAELYHVHPKLLVASRHGKLIPMKAHGDPYTGRSKKVMEQRKVRLGITGRRRRDILEHVLENGAAWEVPIDQVLDRVFAVKKKSRLGSKAVKQAEKLESKGLELNAAEATNYRAMAARANYLSLDRPDLAFAAKELCRDFATPTKISYEKLKRLARYLVGQPRLIMWYPWQISAESINAYCDTDFAGCHQTRRSTSGGIALRGRHPIKHWSQTQTTVSLSSGEAELGGICKGASIGLGLQSIAADLGLRWSLCVHSDATAAIGICRRKGLGRIRHLAVSDLWVQDKIRAGDFTLQKVLGSENPADIMTKHVSRDLINKHLPAMSCRWESGRADSAPEIAQV